MMNSKTKQCQNCKNKFIIEPEDFEFYKKIDVPEPTFCPECRTQRRFTFRNERGLYKRKDDFSKKKIFSIYSDEAPVKVYERDFWWSDKWDPMEYGKDYDFNRPFFEQFGEFIREVPLPSLQVLNLINSDYCSNCKELKNCYLLFASNFNEDCAYGYRVHESSDSYDNFYLGKSELCYQGFMLTNCYKSFFSSHCEDCQEVIFCRNCVGCSDCFGCANLKYKKYHIFNKPYSKEEYFKKLKEFDIGSYQKVSFLEGKAIKHHLKYPVKFMTGRRNNKVSGDYIYNSNNVFDSYIIKDGEDLKYCQFLETKPGAKDCHDACGYGADSKLTYEGSGIGGGNNRIKFSSTCYTSCQNLEYCYNIVSCSNLFGCIGLRKKEYCIFNKQYTKESFDKLRIKIIEQMNEIPYKDKKGRMYKYGEFFPAEISPFAYNETVAQEYFPLSKDQVLKQGYRWYDRPKLEHKATIKANNLPDHIKDVNNSILKEVIECQNEPGNTCLGPGVFRLISNELSFYQKMKLPLPRLCPECRYHKRAKQRTSLMSRQRQCQCAGHTDDTKTYKNTIEHKHKDKHCTNTFQTTYFPDRKEIIYCEACYNKEVS